MDWINLTTADVRTALNPAELDTYRAKVTDGEPDPLPGIIADVTAEVRGYVGGILDLSGTYGIPHSLKNAALDLVVYRLSKRIHTTTDEQRKSAADDARSLLRSVAERKVCLDLTGSSSVGAWGSAENILP